MKKIFSLVLVLILVFSVTSISAHAEASAENTVVITVDKIDFIFSANTSEEFRSNFIAHYMNHDADDAATYGLTCTLFGHKLESSLVTTITHKAKASDPRCLQETFNHEACSRCDYSTSTLISGTYISCC